MGLTLRYKESHSGSSFRAPDPPRPEVMPRAPIHEAILQLFPDANARPERIQEKYENVFMGCGYNPATMAHTDDELKKALKAFKKKLKNTQLDDDSRLGHGPLSSGSSDKVVSVQPPSGFGREIWEELADKGFLKRDGTGFYELVPGKNW